MGAALATCCLTVLGTGLAAAQGDLGTQVERVLADPRLSGAVVGVHVVDLATGSALYARHERRPFIPASNQKLVVAAAALDVLGADYEFRTAVYAMGRVEDGVLRGDLVLRGGGDPTLGGRYDDEDAMDILRRWARVLKAKGVNRVGGDIIGDDSFFDAVYRHPSWDPQQTWKWYFPATGALSINDNCVLVTVRPGPGPGIPAVLSLTPSSAPVKLANLCKTSSTKQSIWFDRTPDSEVIRVGGYVRQDSAGYSCEVTVPQPALYAAAALGQALEMEGIAVTGRARTGSPALGGAEPLCERRTSLLPVLRRMSERSHNHYAEQVVKTIGAEASGRGSWEAGLDRAAQMLRRLGFGSTDFVLDDGSGLSRRNRLTPALLTTLLVATRRSARGEEFASLLAVAGEEGTLESRLSKAPYKGNVQAKSGYLNGVGALSGYARTRSGRTVAFSILINDSRNPPGSYSMRETADAICRAIVDETD
jgi:D-alanyl-D-alanine carboxypeptidase/D-alanyl-D-alanine-endopeptidase (penicillin-binding protein 4)